jgi:hypothetical protein
LICLIRSLGYFLDVLDKKKWVENGILGEKNKGPRFSDQYGGWILGWDYNASSANASDVSFYFGYTWVDDKHFLKNKGKRLGLALQVRVRVVALLGQ